MNSYAKNEYNHAIKLLNFFSLYHFFFRKNTNFRENWEKTTKVVPKLHSCLRYHFTAPSGGLPSYNNLSKRYSCLRKHCLVYPSSSYNNLSKRYSCLRKHCLVYPLQMKLKKILEGKDLFQTLLTSPSLSLSQPSSGSGR